MMTLDLRREVARSQPLPALALGEVSRADLDTARTNWRSRMGSEHASARVFGALIAQMMRAGLPEDETYRVGQMVQQELDHARLCAKVLVALGEEAACEMPALDPVPAHEDASPLEAVLRNVLSISCCSETVAVALVTSERELAGPPAIRHVLDRILRDEVKHARFGWRLVDTLCPSLDAKTRESLDAYLVDVFRHQIDFHGGFLRMGAAEDAGVAIGAADGPANWATFLATVEGVIIPGLARVGLRAEEAWRAAKAI